MNLNENPKIECKRAETHHFVPRGIYSSMVKRTHQLAFKKLEEQLDLRESEVVHVLDSGNRVSIDRHVRKGRVVQGFVSVPVHSKDSSMATQPVAAKSRSISSFAPGTQRKG